MNKLNRKDASILVANCVDHFDTSLYGFLAPVMAPYFFPSDDPVVGLILAYSVLGTSIITRIVGSYIFGLIAINYTSTTSLSYSLIGVAVFTMSIGLIPTYQQIGICAPIALILLRIIRGICSAGESAIAKLHIIEGKTDRLAFRSSHTYQTSTMMGIVLASFASTYVISTEIEYLWRFCFLFGGVVGIFGIYLRQFDTSQEKPKFKRIFSNFTGSFIAIIKYQKLLILQISLVYAFSYLTYSTPFILMNSLMPLISDLTLVDMMKINSGLLVFDLIALPLVGFFVERFNPSKVMTFSGVMLGITLPFLWLFLENASFYYVLLVRAWIVFWGVVFSCPFNLWCFKQIKSQNKYIIIGISSSVGTGLIGKMNPAIGLFIFYQFGNYKYIAIYLSLIMLFTAYMIYKTQGTNK